MTSLAEFVEQLPPDIQKEIKDFAEFLLEKKAKRGVKCLLSIGKVHLRI